MKIIVCIKRVIDYNVRVQINREGDGVVTDGVKMSVNPFDEIAVEEALRIRERGEAEEVIAVSVGTSQSQQQLRTALAMGADRAILIETDDDMQPLVVARVFQKLVEREKPGLVLMGKQAIDDDANQTGQMLAALWNRPQATSASKLELTGDSARATREVDAGLEVIEFDLPAVVTTDLRLNEPRFVKMPDIMKAKRKPMETIALSELSIDLPTQLAQSNYEPPPERQAGRIVDSVEELVAALREKGVV
ncbi:MAG: electron transfer flavoprotein subunit beta/FixA family protein [Gammaproteobacteria bacterium]|nr:electron transfer flavoprotein subunit beta/FixA family protein [Gammaproteobacteria bacterium]MDH3768733.1 electron transfer flavoprotein subunit beta/FixA family protein [Gammaproteobacteria bacterium]